MIRYRTHPPARVRQRTRQLKAEPTGVRAALDEPSTYDATYAALREAAAGTRCWTG